MALNGYLNTGGNTLAAPVGNPLGNVGMYRSAVNRLCMDNFYSRTDDTNPIQAHACHGYPTSQQWSVPGDGTVRIRGKCLDVVGFGTANGSKVQLYACNLTANQLWRPGPNVALVNPVSGRCLDIPSGQPDVQLQIFDCNGGPNQQWTLDFSGVGQIRSAYPGKCLDSYFGLFANGNPAEIYDCNDNIDAQQWSVLGDGRVQILGGLCLDLRDNGTANGTQVWLWICTGTASQQWVIGPNYTLVNVISGRCLDLPAGNTANFTHVQLWDCTGVPQQQWFLPR
jgi:hypothetical protein